MSRGCWVIATACALTLALPAAAQPPGGPLTELSSRADSTMRNPYHIVEDWPELREGMTWGAAIGLIPDNTGGTWMMFRSEPPINYIDANGTITKSFGEGVIVQAHGFCMDHDGNLWAGDSGPFRDDPSTSGRGFQLHKFSPDGELLMSLGQAGVSRAGTDTFIGPTACAVAPNGDIVVADGHWPRPSTAQQDGDRLVRIRPDGTFLQAVGRLGSGPGEFAGPHALAFDSQGRLFVADRSNNRVQIFDQNLQFVDEWRHFGRPSGIAILADDTLIVSDSESGRAIAGPAIAPEGGPAAVPRNPGWQVGIRIGSSRDGSLAEFIPGTLPEGLAGDELGNIFAGLTSGCGDSPSGGCLQKWVRTPAIDHATDVLKAEIEAVMHAEAGGIDRQVEVVDVGDLNVAVGILQRGRLEAGGPVRGITHTNVTEVYYIVSGGGTLVTGGPLTDQTVFDPSSEVVEVIVGPTLLGNFAGGERREVTTGDVVVIPAGVPHGWAEIPDHVDYLSVRPDPDRVLPAGYVNPAASR